MDENVAVCGHNLKFHVKHEQKRKKEKKTKNIVISEGLVDKLLRYQHMCSHVL